jgi:hypothetical protein
MPAVVAPTFVGGAAIDCRCSILLNKPLRCIRVVPGWWSCPASGGRPNDPAGVAGLAGPDPVPGDPRLDRRGVRAGGRAGPVYAPALRVGEDPRPVRPRPRLRPLSFLQAINDFQNDPALAARYQFWIFVYRTGRSVVGWARRLREALGRGVVRD